MIRIKKENKKRKIYLAGCISHYLKNNQKEKATNWRSKIILNTLNCEIYNPMDLFLSDIQNLNHQMGLANNKFHLKQSDIIIVNLTNIEKSPGTLYELFTALSMNKTILGFGEHEWLEIPHFGQCFDYVFKNIDEILQFLPFM